MNTTKVFLITTDNHTLGIQTVANIVYKKKNILPEMFYLPSNLPEYPPSIEEKILHHIIGEIDTANDEVLIGFQLKELSLRRSIQLASRIKKYRGNKVKLVAGGTYAIAEPLTLLTTFDYVVIGSGEGILKVLEAVSQGKDIDPIIMSSSIDFEYPLFTDCWVLNEYGEITRRRIRPLIHPQYKISNALEIMAGVGCNYSCSYCEVATLREMFGNKYKISFAELEQIIMLLRKEIECAPGIKYIYFFDEDFLLKPQEWVEKFARLYSKNVGLPFFIFSTPKSTLKFPNKILTLCQAGLDTINMGIQSGSEKIAKSLFGRKESKDEMKACVYFLTKLYTEGKTTSPPMLDFIILNPYEKVDDLLDTIHLIMDLPVPFNAVMHCMSFFRGTPLYAKAKSEGVIPKNYRFKYDLHDFMSRVKENELQIDYTKKEAIQWLFLNVVLYGMRGIHKVDVIRYYGNFTEKELKGLLSNYTKVSFDEVISLASSLPDPMDAQYFTWEISSESNFQKEDRSYQCFSS
jgi:radical SAM superfamily enzyme YgiQ (UPF0313 family)